MKCALIMSAPPKYINNAAGIPVINPLWAKATGAPVKQAGAVPLAIVSTMDDQAQMGAVTQLPIPNQLSQTVQTMQSPQFVQHFAGTDGGDLIDGLGEIFSRLEIPMGLMSKLMALQGRVLIFTIDDSGSMSSPSNLLFQDASPFMQQLLSNVPRRSQYLNRWQEAEDRLFVLTEILSYVPFHTLILKTFDHEERHGRVFTFPRQAQSPQAFLDAIRRTIRDLFNHNPGGGTPIYANLTNSFQIAKRSFSQNQCFHYIITDGEPNNKALEVRQIKDLLLSPARNAQQNPVTFLGCSNQRSDYMWIHELEEVAPLVASLPDFRDELMDVKNAQGPMFPYSRGL